jgi:hypothetical protein
MQEELRELSFGEMAALCSNLAKGCEKQYPRRGRRAFWAELAALTTEVRAQKRAAKNFPNCRRLIESDLKGRVIRLRERPPHRSGTARRLRAHTWGRVMVSRISWYPMLGKYQIRRRNANGTNVLFCEICGFILSWGKRLRRSAPVCKVPSLKLQMIAKEAV